MMTTIFIRFKNLLTFGLVLLSLSFIWFAITSNKLGNDSILVEDNNYISVEDETGLGEETELDKTLSQPQITIISEEENDLKDHFFSEFRLERERTRGEQVERLNEVVNNPNTSADIRMKAQEDLLCYTNNLGKETKIESALLAKGFTDAVAVIESDSVMVIVPSEGLRDDEIARIADIVTMISGFKMENIVIVPKS